MNNDGECDFLDCQGPQGDIGNNGNCIVTNPNENFVFQGNVTVLGGFNISSDAFSMVEDIMFDNVSASSVTVRDSLLVTGTTNLSGAVQFSDISFAQNANITCTNTMQLVDAGCVEQCPDFSTFERGCIGENAVRFGDIIVESKFAMELDTEVGVNNFLVGSRISSADNYSVFTDRYNLNVETSATMEALNINFTSFGDMRLFAPAQDDQRGLIVIEGERKVIIRSNTYEDSEIVLDGDVEVTGDLILNRLDVAQLRVDDMEAEDLIVDDLVATNVLADVFVASNFIQTPLLLVDTMAPNTGSSINIVSPIETLELQADRVVPATTSITFNTANALFSGSLFVDNIRNSAGPVVIDDDLTVTGSVDFQDDVTVTGNMLVSGSLAVLGTFTCPSDRRIKKNIREITLEESQQFLEQLQPVKYQYRENLKEVHSDPEKLKGDYFGFIAQDSPKEMRHIAPTGYYSLDYLATIPHMVNSLKDLDARLKKLEEMLL